MPEQCVEVVLFPPSGNQALPTMSVLAAVVPFLVKRVFRASPQRESIEVRQRSAFRLQNPPGCLHLGQTWHVLQGTTVAWVRSETIGEQSPISGKASAELRKAISEAGPISCGRGALAISQAQATQSGGGGELALRLPPTCR